MNSHRVQQATIPMLLGLALLPMFLLSAAAEDPPAESLADRRLAEIRTHIETFRFVGGNPPVPARLGIEPIFRYDDETRGYCDGTVWRLRETGRPAAIVTAELHPRYNSQPSIVYDLLSFSPQGFNAKFEHNGAWQPTGSALSFANLSVAVPPGKTAARRMTEAKDIARQFSATQEILENSIQPVNVSLRLLPQPIDRYVPDDEGSPFADGWLFLFVNGRNPGIVLVLETDGTGWRYAAGRLSLPSTLTLLHENVPVWTVERNEYPSDLSYSATNFPANVPAP